MSRAEALCRTITGLTFDELFTRLANLGNPAADGMAGVISQMAKFADRAENEMRDEISLMRLTLDNLELALNASGTGDSDVTVYTKSSYDGIGNKLNNVAISHETLLACLTEHLGKVADLLENP